MKAVVTGLSRNLDTSMWAFMVALWYTLLSLLFVTIMALAITNVLRAIY